MNCLNTRGVRREYQFIEPTAPTYYPPQPPFNPEFFYEHSDYEFTTETSYKWDLHSAESAYEGDDECERWGRERRSLYEGVNCMPVSATAWVRCATRHRTGRAYAPTSISFNSVLFMCDQCSEV